jgi:chromosome segregation and condensation protein ScpB
LYSPTYSISPVFQKKFNIDKEHQFPDQTEEMKEEGLRG